MWVLLNKKKTSFAPHSHPPHGYNNAMPYHRHIQYSRSTYRQKTTHIE